MKLLLTYKLKTTSKICEIILDYKNLSLLKKSQLMYNSNLLIYVYLKKNWHNPTTIFGIHTNGGELSNKMFPIQKHVEYFIQSD